MSREWAIRVEGLTKRYGGKAAVDGLDLDVPTGSVFGLLGENGAGKSTTIRAILGLIAPDRGKIETLRLDPITQGLEVRRRVGYVPEVPGLYDWMTVAEIGWFAAGFHDSCPGGSDGYQRRYASLVEGFDLPARRKIKALSKGMRAKVGLAVALSSEPDLLVLDEPTSGLDAMVRREFLESMVELAGEGRTVFLSSHQIGEVERVASHVALLHQGRLVLSEPLDELKARTHWITLILSGADRPAIPEGVEVVDASESARQSRWLVHASDRSALESMRSAPGVDAIEIETPSLEDIYISYMRKRAPSSAPGPMPVGSLV
ncbi:ABC transporter ATP-binding protein [Tundrisphaera lichenicola]|uniref:ABC transporter ATP-binding protein n=1 Tax=Tundrisphaera lichenicola TaxID=2029860 RepID=UPI003EC0307C